MITLVTGVPGAGKSYYAVYQIYQFLKTQDDFLIVSNIEGTEKIKDTRYVYYDLGLDALDFFKKENMEQYLYDLRQEHSLGSSSKVYLFIDEAQRYFDRYLKDKDTIYFFDYHRHLGIDIYLITQHRDKISKQINTLVEFEVRAVPPKLSIVPGRFLYNQIMGKEVFGKKTVPVKKEVFSLYKSFDKGTKCKRSYKLVLMVLIPAIISIFAFWHLLTNVLGGDKEPVAEAAQVKAPSVQEYMAKISIPEPKVIQEKVVENNATEKAKFKYELCTLQIERYTDGRIYYKDTMKNDRVYNVDLNGFERALSIRYDYYLLSFHGSELYCSVMIDNKLIQIYPRD